MFIDDDTATIKFSKDTIFFDTVFTGIGSATKSFRIVNPHKQKIKISTISLMGGNSSAYRINIDGVPGNQFSDIEILAEDSLYGFVEVTIDPNNWLSPFIVNDDIQFVTNGNLQYIHLQSYGQNAYYHKHETICDTIWSADKPHVIVDYVYIDSLCYLKIDAGTRVYTFGNYDDPYQVKGRILVGGRLLAIGKIDSMIEFRGARLEAAFINAPGQWNGIEFFPAAEGSIFSYSMIQGATIGMKIDSMPATSTAYNFTIDHSIIRNISSAAISALSGKLKATNCLIYNCYGQSLSFNYGGHYELNHSTISRGSDKGLLGIANNLTIGGVTYGYADLYARFTNCIIFGNYSEEIVQLNLSGAAWDVQYQNCLLKTEMSGTEFVSCIINENPNFINTTDTFNFRLQSISSAINTGINTGVLDDLDAYTRDVLPDIGCYEFH